MDKHIEKECYAFFRNDECPFKKEVKENFRYCWTDCKEYLPLHIIHRKENERRYK